MISELPDKNEDLAQTEVAVIDLARAEKKKILRKLDWFWFHSSTVLYLLRSWTAVTVCVHPTDKATTR